MNRLLRRRPSPAMVVACIALAIALGGTSYAAIRLPANSVGTKQLKKNAVTKAKIAANAVNGSKVAPDSLTGANIMESSLGTVPSATNATNATNAANATHATSADSATNATHATSADTATSAAVGTLKARFATCTNPAGTQTRCEVTCPSGLYAVGGGVNNNGTHAADQWVNGTYPGFTEGGIGWIAFSDNNSPGDLSMEVSVLCVNAASAGVAGASAIEK